MTKQMQGDPAPQNEREHQRVGLMIAKQVMQVLGEPCDLRRVQVQHLWANHYRVNVCVGADMASAKVAHSYFLSVDDDGAITSSTPTIGRHY